MFDEGNIIAGLEIGTSKICVVVGEQTADGGFGTHQAGLGHVVVGAGDKFLCQ